MAAVVAEDAASAWEGEHSMQRRISSAASRAICAALLLWVTAARPAVYLALALQGLASSLIGPGVAAISLALVGQAALSERIGRNARFASIGNGLAAGTMGVAGSYLPTGSVFLVAAVLVVPAI